MMKVYFVGTLLFVLVGLVACGPSKAVTEDEATAGAPLPAATESVEEEEETAVPAQLPEAPDVGYPVATVAPVIPESYPIATVAPLSNNPYPIEGPTWVFRPVGVQCETADYVDIQDAITDLTALRIDVLDSDTFSLEVASVCGGSTSAHFKVLVNAADAQNMLTIGWQLLPEE